MLRRQHVRTGLALVAVSASLAACSVAGALSEGGSPGPGVAQAVIAIRPDGERSWHPDRPVIVSVTNGRLTDIQVVDRQGRSVRGRTLADHTVWRSTAPLLRFDTHYRVRAVAVDAAGKSTRVSSSFRTEKPVHRVHVGIQPVDGQVVGVGMPVIVSFDAPVANHAVAERRLTVQTSPAVKGGWYWVGDQQVRWRPRDYWEPGTKVDVRADLAGIRLGPGTWGDENEHVAFEVGDSMVSTVDIADHTMTVRRNGEVVRTVPVTTGKPGWDTRNGIKVIISKDRQVVMDAATIDVDKNDPEYYRLDVEYAMRVTWSGEYLHAAPWSVSSQGKENVSHGCTGMSLEDAAWFYNLSKPGDVVVFVNGTRPLEPWNGWTDWNMPWDQWRAGSALH
jgi:lipoprotein-anchoring transpeptidase ErfK/SrfK